MHDADLEVLADEIHSSLTAASRSFEWVDAKLTLRHLKQPEPLTVPIHIMTDVVYASLSSEMRNDLINQTRHNRDGTLIIIATPHVMPHELSSLIAPLVQGIDPGSTFAFEKLNALPSGAWASASPATHLPLVANPIMVSQQSRAIAHARYEVVQVHVCSHYLVNLSQDSLRIMHVTTDDDHKYSPHLACCRVCCRSTSCHPSASSGTWDMACALPTMLLATMVA